MAVKEIILGSILALSAILYKTVEAFNHSLILIILLMVAPVLLILWEAKSFPKGMDKVKIIARIFFIFNKIIWYFAIVFAALNYPGKETIFYTGAITNIILLSVMFAVKCKKTYLALVASYLIAGSSLFFLLGN